MYNHLRTYTTTIMKAKSKPKPTYRYINQNLLIITRIKSGSPSLLQKTIYRPRYTYPSYLNITPGVLSFFTYTY